MLTVSQRLRPLYIASFLQSSMLWYAIEKVFMREEIDFTDSQIALAGVVLSASMVLFQIPTGILADRWSRKKVLISSSVVLTVCTIVAGLSQSILVFLISSMLWGIYAAMCIGVYDSIVYDLLEESGKQTEEYEHYYGRVRLWHSLGLVLGALSGGVVASVFNIYMTFWVSIPLALLSIVFLYKFKEPLIHQSQYKSSLVTHTLDTVKAALNNTAILWVITSLILLGVLDRILDNLSTLWYLSFGLPIFFYGPAYALVQASMGFAGPVAVWVKHSSFKILSLLFLSLFASIMLTLDISVILIIGAQTFLLTACSVLIIFLSHKLHDNLPSHLRAGSASVVGTLAQLSFLPITYLFGWLSQKYNVFNASWVLVFLTFSIVIIYLTKVFGKEKVELRDMNEAEKYTTRDTI